MTFATPSDLYQVDTNSCQQSKDLPALAAGPTSGDAAGI